MAKFQTVDVSPIDLAVGDRVYSHGALMEVVYIIRTADGVAACISKLIGEETGSIPRGWFDCKQSMIERGCSDWAKEHLVDGEKYWNVQGNHLARVAKVVG